MLLGVIDRERENTVSLGRIYHVTTCTALFFSYLIVHGVSNINRLKFGLLSARPNRAIA